MTPDAKKIVKFVVSRVISGVFDHFPTSAPKLVFFVPLCGAGCGILFCWLITISSREPTAAVAMSVVVIGLRYYSI